MIAEVRVAAKYAEREQREAQKREQEKREQEKREREELAREERERDAASPEQALIGEPADDPTGPDEPIGVKEEPADKAPVGAVPPSVEGGPAPGASVEPEPFVSALIGAPPDLQAVADEPSLLRSTGPEVDGTPVIVTGPSDGAFIAARPGVQSVADEPVDRGVPGSADDVPVIAFKPADAVPPPPEPAPPPTPPEAEVRVKGPSERVRVVVRDPLTRPAPGPAEDVSPPIPPQPISRLQRGEPIIDEEAPPLVGRSVDRLRTATSSWAGSVRERTARLVEGARAGERPPRLVSTVETATAAVSSWVASLRNREGGAELIESVAPPSIPVPPPRPSPPDEPSLPGFEARAPRPSRIETPSPPARLRPPAIPPPPTTDVDVIPLAEPVRPREPEEEDTYDDGRDGGLLPAAWALTKILLVIAIAVGSTVYAAVNWRTWFPKAAEVGEATFTELDRVARSAERAAQQQRAVEELSAELPHLAPETIRLILSRSPSGVLEAPAVFEIAGDATDRGLAALTAEEAREVDELGFALQDGLGPLERERLRDYARIRSRRVVFTEEHAHALALVARGARTLPAEKRARLQGLLSKAISAGLDPPPAGRRQ